MRNTLTGVLNRGRSNSGMLSGCGWLLVGLGLLPGTLGQAGEPTFPWGEPSLMVSPQPVHRVLSSPQGHGVHRSRPVSVQPLPSKPAYHYGWFGSQPTAHQWGRHFGFSKNFTQWTSR